MAYSFSIDEELLPARLTARPMTDEEFLDVCAEHPDLFFEMTADGELIVTPPNLTYTGAQHNEIQRQLGNWAVADSRGVATDAAGGFVLPNGARRSPDAAWTLKIRLQQLDSNQLRLRYWHVSPDFVIEVKSPSDRWRTLREKMHEWIDNGAQLGWLIDPGDYRVEIYRPNTGPETLQRPESVHGEGPVEGFILNLARVWDPFQL